MKFIADVMLGKLARFLRMIGQDVIYFADADDDFIIYSAKETRRILLTRDVRLYQSARLLGIPAVLVCSNHVKEQLKEVIEATKLVPEKAKRCIVCNAPLKSVERCEIEGLVPEFVWMRNSEFWICEGCGKVYWRGSHIKNFIKFLGFDPWEK